MKKLVSTMMLMPLMAFAYSTWTDSQTGITWTYTDRGNGTVSIGGDSEHPAVLPTTSGALVTPVSINGHDVRYVGDFAFASCDRITSITISPGIVEVGANAFKGCTGLNSVTIPLSVYNIGYGAFSGCGGLTNMKLPFVGARRGNSGSESLFGYIFGRASYAGATKIEQWFEEHVYTSYYIPASLKEVEITDETVIGYGAFCNCSGLTSVSISQSVTNIGYGVFRGCSGLTSITLPFVGSQRGNSGWAGSLFGYIFGTSSYGGAKNVKQSYDEGGWWGTYYVPASLRTVVITDETVIGYGAFGDCSNLLSVSIPPSVTSIGACAFQGGQFTSVTIPNSVTNIGANAFAGCTKLKWITFPANMEIRRERLYELGLTDEFMAGCRVGDFIAINTTVLEYVGDRAVATLTIPSGTTVIDDEALARLDNLATVKFAGTERVLGARALKDCVSLETVELPECLEEIGEGAFAGLGSLEKVTMPASVRRIETSAFAMDTRLANVVLPEGLEFIGDEAFYGCTKLANVIVPGSVKSVGKRVFKQCTAMTNAQIAYGVGSIGEECFFGDWRISEVDLPRTVTNIGVNAFGGDSSIIRAGLRCDVRKMSEIFSNYQHIREIIVKEGDGEIVDGCFKDCIELKDVRYMGDCPALENSGRNLYANTFNSNGLMLVSYVLPGSTGWDGIATSDELPQAWPLVGSNRRPIAHWDVPTYLCRFDSNGGTLGVQDTYQYSEKYVVLPPEPVQSGYRFAGWWTQPVGGLRVTEHTIFIEGVYAYLWAHWEKGHTVFLDPNGGTIINDFVTYVDESVYGVLPTPVKSGYAFDGWLYNGEKIEPDSKINEQADHTLMAQWRAIKSSIIRMAGRGIW